MMKRNKLITGILAMLLVLPLFLGLGSAKDVMASVGTADLSIHKKKMTSLPNPLIQNTGAEMDAFDQYEPLPDVEFKVYDVTQEFYDVYNEAGKTQADALAAAKNANVSTKTAVASGETNADGDLYLADLPKKSGAQDAVYVIVETQEKGSGVTAAENMVVAFPVYEMNAKGEYTKEELGTIHLYPKNVVAIDGSLVVTKKGTGKGELLDGAEFIISRTVVNDTVKEYLSGATLGTFTWTKTEADAFKFYTGKTYITTGTGISGVDDSTGILNIAGFEYGDYVLTETDTPENAGLIQDDYPFTISSNEKSVAFEVKNDTTLVEKKIAEIKEGGNSYGIGEEIPYEISANIPEGIARKNGDGTNYYTQFDLQDTHDTTLTFNGGKLYIRDKSTPPIDTELTGVGYTVTETAAKDQFNVVITPADIPNLPAGGKLVFKYTMALNDTADPDKEFKNTAKVVTSHTTGTSTPVIVKTGGKRFVKIDADSKATLKGAKFVVKKGNQFLALDADNKVSWTATEADADVFTTLDNGIVDIRGLEYGAYTLVETKAPEGYVLPANPNTPFTISDGSYGSGTTLVKPADVPNKRRGSLPSTGGTGIVAFVLIGVVAVGGAALYFTKGRRQIEG